MALAGAPRIARGRAFPITDYLMEDNDRVGAVEGRSNTAPRRDRVLLAFAAVLALNTALVVVAFASVWQLRNSLRRALLVTMPTIAASQRQSAPPLERRVRIDLYSDFGCEFCRESASAVDSAREVYGSNTEWRYWNAPKSPDVDPLSFRGALAAVCVSRSGDPWALYSQLSESSDWSEEVLDSAVRAVASNPDSVRTCMASTEAESAVWGELFALARRGISRTPTIVVDGRQITGSIHYEPLAQLIDSRLRAREADPPSPNEP